MNKMDNTKLVRFTLTETGTATILKIYILKTSTPKHQNNYYKLCFEQPINSCDHKTAGLLSVKIEKKTFCTFVNYFTKLKTNKLLQNTKYVLPK
jgi:protoheme ferro-lyase